MTAHELTPAEPAAEPAEPAAEPAEPEPEHGDSDDDYSDDGDSDESPAAAPLEPADVPRSLVERILARESFAEHADPDAARRAEVDRLMAEKPWDQPVEPGDEWWWHVPSMIDDDDWQEPPLDPAETDDAADLRDWFLDYTAAELRIAPSIRNRMTEEEAERIYRQTVEELHAEMLPEGWREEFERRQPLSRGAATPEAAAWRERADAAMFAAVGWQECHAEHLGTLQTHYQLQDLEKPRDETRRLWDADCRTLASLRAAMAMDIPEDVRRAVRECAEDAYAGTLTAVTAGL